MAMRYVGMALLCMIMSLSVNAQRWSYVYVQGDKKIPFYVKLEDEMLPRYSKNYCIIPQLSAGPVHLQILFQKNQYPPQNFTVLVPEDGFRGFILTFKDKSFALYDVHQHFFLLPGSAGVDRLPEGVPAAPPKEVADALNPPEGSEDLTTTEPQFMPGVTLDREATQEPETEVNNTAIATPSNPTVAGGRPRTMTPAVMPPTRTLPRATNVGNEPAVEERSNDASGSRNGASRSGWDELTTSLPDVADEAGKDLILDLGAEEGRQNNIACPNAMSEREFDELYNSTIGKKGDDKRILFLMKNIEKRCYSTRQAAILASRLQAESMRFNLLKKIYPRISDPQYFPRLEQLFKTLEWKAYFKLIP